MLQKTGVDDNLSNLTSAATISNEASISSTNTNTINHHHHHHHLNHEMAANSSILYPTNNTNNLEITNHPQQQQQTKKRRNLPGNPDPESEVVALSPGSLMATNRFVCEICNKGFQRDQNLQLHRRGHNLPWKLKQRNKLEIVKRKVYVCPETSCVHHDPSRALGDLTGIKKHFSRKHGEKKWKCDKCSKRYAVQSDWKAHSKICGTREYRCDCGTLFSRRDSFITHRAFCDALAQESSRSITTQNQNQLFMSPPPNHNHNHHLNFNNNNNINNNNNFHNINNNNNNHPNLLIPSSSSSQQHLKQENLGHQNLINLPPWLSSDNNQVFNARVERSIHHQDQNPNPNNNFSTSSSSASSPSSLMSATALLQKAAQMGVTMSASPGATKMAYQSSSPSDNNNNNNNNDNVFVNGLGSSFGSKGGGGGAMMLSNNQGGMNMVSSTLPSMTTAFEDSFNEMLNPVPISSKSRMIMSLGGGFQDNNNNNNSLMNLGVRKNGGGDEGLTRDFLGLRAFPAVVDHRDFMTMAAAANLHHDQMGSYDHHHRQHQHQQQQQAQNHQGPWQSR